MIRLQTCEQVRSELTHFVVAQLDAEATLTVARHLARCASCAGEEAALRRTSLLLRQWQPSPLRVEVNEAIKSAGRTQMTEVGRVLEPRRRPCVVTWAERWASLLDAAQAAQKPLAPVAFAFLSIATLAVLLVLIRDPSDAARTSGLFLAGMWCTTVANAVIGLALGEANSMEMARRLRIDLRATALSATLAGGLVALMFVFAGLVKTMWVGEFMRSDNLRVLLYSMTSFLVVGAAVAMASRLTSAGGRISGAMVGLIYAAFAGPLVYIVIGFRLDVFWLLAESCLLVAAVAGGLVGDSITLRRGSRI